MKVASVNNIRKMVPFVFLVPPLLFLFFIVIYPFAFSLKLAFYRWNLINVLDQYFIGVGNFLRMFRDSLFWNAIRVTFVYVAVATVVEFFIGLALALIVAQDLKGMRIIRSLLLIPMTMTPLVVGLMWRYMLNPSYGIVNYLINSVTGISPPQWLSDPILALPTLIFVDIWQWTPFMFVILLAGVQSLPKEPYEAAQVDGARKHQILFFVTLPLLRPIILVAALLRIIDTFRVYDLVYSMTRGGPINTTQNLSWYIYQVGFKFYEFGYASSLSWIMLIISIAICTQLIRVIYKQT